MWNVTNAEGSGYGSMTLRSATVNSVNTVYAQLIDRLGPDVVNEAATRMGMRCCGRVARPRGRLDPYLSSVLGANEANTLEMASAYGTLATGGRHAHPLPVAEITDAHGDVIWEADPKPKQVVEPHVAAQAGDILQDVVSSGTGTAATIGRPQIGKTGTDEDHANAWFVGAVPQLATAVWVGYHEGELPMEPPRTRITVFGGTWPAQIWRLTMIRATAGMPLMSFPTPSVDYLTVPVDVTQDPYCLPNRYTLPQNIESLRFIEGTEPLDECTQPDVGAARDRALDRRVPPDRRHDPAPGGRVLRRGGARRVDAAARHRGRTRTLRAARRASRRAPSGSASRRRPRRREPDVGPREGGTRGVDEAPRPLAGDAQADPLGHADALGVDRGSAFDPHLGASDEVGAVERSIDGEGLRPPRRAREQLPVVPGPGPSASHRARAVDRLAGSQQHRAPPARLVRSRRSCTSASRR